MAIEEKNILNRLYLIAGCMFIFAIAITVKLVNIQMVDGEKYRDLAERNTTKNFTISANRGNVYADDGSLLATSVPKYDVRFDAVTVSASDFNEFVAPLSKELSKLLGNSPSYYQDRFRKARTNRNRYLLVAKGLGFSDYMHVKSMPLFKLGPYKGGFITEQYTVREHPLGKIGERLVGNENRNEPGVYEVGFEGAFDAHLRGKEGRRLKQKIAKGQWKPVFDDNEIEPQDGYDIISTIDVNIQDIAHHALLKQLEYYEADHGCVIVMETKTGAIKAVSNLKRTSSGTYYEARNYALWESIEPGSTFKTMAFMAALEDGKIDTARVVDTRNGVKQFYGRKIHDSRKGGFGKISAARALEVSSNIGLATLIDDAYSNDPKQFIDRLRSWHLDKQIGVPIKGEGKPVIYQPGDRYWSKNALPSMAYGYNLQLTPLQTLMFYNAVANDGVMVKPRFINEVRARNKTVEFYDTEVLNEQICSKETIDQIQEILKNIVRRGTGETLYSEYFSMAGKTGTARTEYTDPDWEENRRYISSFAGYFPAEDPKFSCIVVIHKPSIQKGYYGADVTGPVFKRIAQKIFTDSPLIAQVTDIDLVDRDLQQGYNNFYDLSRGGGNTVPNVVGMTGMDAASLLENLGLKVELVGNGMVRKQSIPDGSLVKKGRTIVLHLS